MYLLYFFLLFSYCFFFWFPIVDNCEYEKFQKKGQVKPRILNWLLKTILILNL